MSNESTATDGRALAGDRVVLGNERIFSDARHLIAGKRVGLITNPSGVNARAQTTADLLHQADDVQLTALFGPEHGVRGVAPDGVAVPSSRDEKTDVPLYSLYGDRREPDEAMLKDIDVMLIDLQDVGVRFYTYLYTMSLSMSACARHGVRFVVLDRPNPIGGSRVEGNILDPAFASFVGLFPIPIRYGLTMGEIAGLFNDQFALDVDLQVVELKNWRRSSWWDETGLPWIPPSPNMRTLDTAILYPGMCFLEGTNVSEGRGTERPFEQVGAPFIHGEALAHRLNSLNLPGVSFQSIAFQPTEGKHAGADCKGVCVQVADRELLQPIDVGLEVVAAIRTLCPDDFAWHIPDGGIHNFDRLAGTDQLRHAIDAGTPVAELVAGWQEQLQPFIEIRKRYLLY